MNKTDKKILLVDLFDLNINKDQIVTYIRTTMAPLIHIYICTDSIAILGHANSTK